MSRIKYGQIGVGHAHANKISVYRKSADYEVVGVAEPDDQLRSKAEASDTYRDVKWMTVEQLLNTEGLQVVGVETRVRDLLSTAEDCIAAEKHIHLDKPAGASLSHFKRILDAAARKHLAVQLGYMYRFNPALVMMRDLLKKGWLGEPFEIHTVMSKTSGAGARREMAEFRGGTMFELGCHVLDLVVSVLGPPDRVHAFPRKSPTIGDGLNDNMLAVLEYPQATATIRSSVNEVEGFARRHFAICGTDGTMHIQPLDRPSAKIALARPQGRLRQGYQDLAFEPPYERYVGDAADLAAIVRMEKESDFTYEHDFAVQRTVLLASDMPIDN